MLNPDILGKADKAHSARTEGAWRNSPGFAWKVVVPGINQEDSLWIEVNVLGSSGLRHLGDLLRTLDSKLSGTDCRVDCLFSYTADTECRSRSARLDSRSDRGILAGSW